MGALQQVSIRNSNSEKWYGSLTSNDLETGHITCVVSYVTVFARAVVFGVVDWKFAFELLEIASSAPLSHSSMMFLYENHKEMSWVRSVLGPVSCHHINHVLTYLFKICFKQHMPQLCMLQRYRVVRRHFDPMQCSPILKISAKVRQCLHAQRRCWLKQRQKTYIAARIMHPTSYRL